MITENKFITVYSTLLRRQAYLHSPVKYVYTCSCVIVCYS